MNKIVFTLLGLLLAGSAAAKLPPPSDDAKAKAAEAKEKSAWADKVSAYQLCVSQDKVAARYNKSKPAKPGAAAASACQNPGPFVAQTAAAPAAAMPAAPAAPAAKPTLAAKK
ncbi:MAG: hypothetical protein JWP36_2914 [Paucimonas sp.]|nr:hypothetical protein [Paucimonas sp.]